MGDVLIAYSPHIPDHQPVEGQRIALNQAEFCRQRKSNQQTFGYWAP
jgi:hypothetical protein